MDEGSLNPIFRSEVRLARASKKVEVVTGGLANRICHLANLIRLGQKRLVLWTKMDCPVAYAELFDSDFGLKILDTDETFETRASVLTCAPQMSLFRDIGEAKQVIREVMDAMHGVAGSGRLRVGVHGRFLCNRVSAGQVADFAAAINGFIREREIQEVFLLSDSHRGGLKSLLQARVTEARCREMTHDGDRNRADVLQFAADLKDLCQAQFVLSNNGASSVLHLTGAAGATNYVLGAVKEMRPSMFDIRGIKPLFTPRPTAQLRDDLAVVSCYYNFGNYDTSRRNLLRFVRQMGRDGVRVYGVEAYLAGERPLTSHLPGWKQIELTDRQVLWHKESLLNLAEKELVPLNISNLVFMDADVWYDEPNWADKVIKSLRERPVVQPFETAVWTGRDGQEVRHKPSAALAGLQNWAGHCGFAWAMRREVLKDIGGLFDLGLLGGGDHMLAFACLHEKPMEEMAKRQILSAITLESDGVISEAYSRWAAGLYAWTGGHVGWIEANLYHEWHGELVHRQYHARGQVLRGLRLEKDLERLPNGTWSWSAECDPERMASVQEYFRSRSENG